MKSPLHWRRLFAIPELGILIPLLALTAFFYWVQPSILNGGSIGAMLRGMSFVGVVGIGMTLLMVAGEIDLSVGSVAGLCAIVCSWLMTKAGWPVPLAIVGGVGVGGLVGFVNGWLTVVVGLPAFITTLGMLYIARGLNYLICAGYPIYPLPDSVKHFGTANTLGTSWSFIIFIMLVFLVDAGMRWTTWGRMIYATGGNPEVARLAGISTTRVKVGCFVATGMLAALGGILLMSRIAVGQPEIGTGWELEVIAAVVIGGVSLFGGVGTVAGTLLGLAIMQVIRAGLVSTNVNTHWQTVAVGVIMILAVGVDLLRRRAKIHA
ncbi:MAG TPA: ABC transporter permease [Verrucomicrobiae bacterium]|jgi:ribose transport system permease protein